MRLIVLLFSTLLAYLAVEVGYRAYAFHSIRSALLAATLSQMSDRFAGADPFSDVLVSSSVFDMHTGYRYRPDIEVRSSSPVPIAWRTNSHGHVARGEYPIAKPSGEFRIGLVGDSFTANVINTIRWGDVLEDRLNASDPWSAIVGGKHVRVINFGLDGIGVVQFDDVAAEMAVPFEVDLLLVNLIRQDVWRRPYYRGGATFGSREELTRYVESEMLLKLPLWSIYPEVIAATLGRPFGMTPRLTAQEGVAVLIGPPGYERAEDAIDASVAAVRRLRCFFPDAIFLVHPMRGDLDPDNAPLVTETFEGFVRGLSEVEFVDMLAVLPTPSSDSEWDSWFNYPKDLHNSDLGLRVYGESVASYLLDRFGGRQLPGAQATVPGRAACS